MIKERGRKEFNIIKERYGIVKEEYQVSENVSKDTVFVLDNDGGLSEQFLKRKPNVITHRQISELSEVVELVAPQLPMLINTIENAYQNIAVYGRSPYAKKIFEYLLQNKEITVTYVEDSKLEYRDHKYYIDSDESFEMLLVMDLLVNREVFNKRGDQIITVFSVDMYRADLKSTRNNADINQYIIPKLLENGVNVIWIGTPNINKLVSSKKIKLTIKVWSLIRHISERFFSELRNRKFHTLYLQEESLAAHNSNSKGISEVFFNGEYINFDNGFRRTPQNDPAVENNIWLFGPCCVRGLNFDDSHTMSAKLKEMVGNDYNVMNRGTMNTCLNYVMRMAEYSRGDVAAFFSPDYVPEHKNERVCYIDGNDIFNKVPSLEKHITDSLYHCDGIVIDEVVKSIYKNIGKLSIECGEKKKVTFGSRRKRVPALDMYEQNHFTDWLRSLDQYKKAGNNGAIVMNANPFTYGHRYLVEYAASKVDYLYVMVVEEDKSFFKFEERYKLVKEGTADLKNVIVFPSSQYIISSSSLPGYFKKENMQGDILLDATQDIVSFAQVAEALNIHVRFCGEEPKDLFTKRYNDNMEKLLPQYGIEFEVIDRKTCAGEVISASRVRNCLKEGKLEEIKGLVPDTTYNYLKQKYQNK